MKIAVALLGMLAVLAGGAVRAVTSSVPADEAQRFVAAADHVRNPDQPFESIATLTQYVNGKAHEQIVVAVYVKAAPGTQRLRNLIRYHAPPADLGKSILIDGDSVWFYDSDSKSSVPVSPQQRLLGQASISDVLTVNLAAEYSSTFVGYESIKDADRMIRNCVHVRLDASKPYSAYRRLDYWIDRDKGYPVKLIFYADSGLPLKTVYYRGFQAALGRVRPTEAIILDEVDRTQVTTVDFGDAKFQDIPDSWFQRAYLPRLEMH